jgi:hypothetical protein
LSQFPFYGSSTRSLKSLHPDPDLVPNYLATFFANVDPVCKVLHKPAIYASTKLAFRDLDAIHKKGFEALLFTIYFGAVTSLDESDCEKEFRTSRVELLRRYRFGLETSLTNADFLRSTDISLLQALCLYLTVLRATDKSRYGWSLTAVAFRLAQAHGIHREASLAAFSPFEREMRRRLWWELLGLDQRSNEDRGSDPTVTEDSFDTEMALNINDDDFSPDTIEMPPERKGVTDIIIARITHEFFRIDFRLNYVAPKSTPMDELASFVALKERENMVSALAQYIHVKYLVHLDLNTAYGRISNALAQIIISRLWLSVHYPLQRRHVSITPQREQLQRGLEMSLFVLGVRDTFCKSKDSDGFRWMIGTYVQWHSWAVALAALCVLTAGPLVDQAWVIVEDGFKTVERIIADSKGGSLWRPIVRLHTKALEARKKALAEVTQSSVVDITESLSLYAATSGDFQPSTAAYAPTISLTAQQQAIISDTFHLPVENLASLPAGDSTFQMRQPIDPSELMTDLYINDIGMATGNQRSPMNPADWGDFEVWNGFLDDAQQDSGGANFNDLFGP